MTSSSDFSPWQRGSRNAAAEANALHIVVTGEKQSALQTLGASLPSANLTVATGTETIDLAAVSANAHLVVCLGELASRDQATAWCDAVVRTDGDLADFVTRARDYDRLRRARQLPPDVAPVIEDWSPDWARTARRVGARVARAFGGLQVSVDHIGSTSVPGLNAKCIIDLQVTVSNLAHCDAVDLRLKDAGFVNVQEIVPEAPGVLSDNPRGDNVAGDDWAKRLYAGVDAAQRAIVHVRRRDAANWRYALLFRDWLRANEAPRNAYGELKRDLASLHRTDPNFDDYARAKDFWFDQAHDAMERWALEAKWAPSSGAEGQ